MNDFIVPDRRGLVAEFLLDGNALDTSGNGNNGTETNVTYANTDRGYQSQCGVFNGSSAYVSANDANQIDLTSEYTISAVLEMSSLPSSGNLYAIVDKNVSNRNGYEFELWNDAGTQKIFVSHLNAYTAATYSINYSLPTGRPILLSARFSGTTVDFLLDGNVIGTVTSVTVSPTAGTSVLNIGRNPQISSRYFNGKMQSVRIFNAALSETEIRNWYLESLRALGGSTISGLMDGIVSYYDFQGDANDIIGGNNGTLNGSPSTDTDRFGSNGAIAFNGSSQYMSSTNRPVALSGNATIAAWVKFNVNSAADHHIVNLHSSDNAAQMSFFMNGSANQVRLRCWSGSADTDAGTTTVSDGQWYYLVGTKSGSLITFYVNGVSVGTNTMGSLSGSAGGGLYVGRFALSSVNFWKGSVSEVFALNRALSSDEVSALYQLSQKGKILPFGATAYQREGLPKELQLGCVLYVPGVVSGTTAYDASGNGNNGTLVNSPTRVRRQGYSGFDYNGSTQSCTFPNINSLRSFSCNIRYDANNKTILLISAGNSISISSSNTITVTGLTNATVYVNGTTANSLSSGKWYRITVNFDSVNSSSGSIANSSFDGLLFDPILRTNALSATEAMLDAKTFFIP